MEEKIKLLVEDYFSIYPELAIFNSKEEVELSLIQKANEENLSLEELDRILKLKILEVKNYLQNLLNYDIVYNNKKDCFFKISKNPEKGFLFDYVLYIPKDVSFETTLIMESSNSKSPMPNLETGLLQAEVHAAKCFKKESSKRFSKLFSDEFKLPVIMPLMPRYLDELGIEHFPQIFNEKELKNEAYYARNMPLQIVNIIKDAKEKLNEMGIKVEDKIISIGFSASSRFGNRFTTLHPELVKAQIMGGTGGEMNLFTDDFNGLDLPFPIGTCDLEKYVIRKPNNEEYYNIPSLYFLGLEENDYHDTVFSNNICTLKEKELWKEATGRERDVKKRFIREKEILEKLGLPINSIFVAGNHEEFPAYEEAREFIKEVLENSNELKNKNNVTLKRVKNGYLEICIIIFGVVILGVFLAIIIIR